MDQRLLVAAGIDPSLPVASQAAELVRRLPLRRRPPEGQRDVATVVESRWFAGLTECHRVLGRLFRGTAGRGICLGTAWPTLEAAGSVVAPALPVVAGPSEQEGPDGIYQLADGIVWREGAGERRAFLTLHADGDTGSGFDLLWFGPTERYLMRAGVLHVEDLFSLLTVTPSQALLERLLVRGMRLEEEVLVGVEPGDRRADSELEVRRPVELMPSDSWRDPAAVMAVRADIASARRRGDEILVRTEADRPVEFKLDEDRDGWRLFAWQGDYPYRTLNLHRRGDHLRLSATLADGIDPLAPGARSRLAFDLRSTLVALD